MNAIEHKYIKDIEHDVFAQVHMTQSLSAVLCVLPEKPANVTPKSLHNIGTSSTSITPEQTTNITKTAQNK